MTALKISLAFTSLCRTPYMVKNRKHKSEERTVSISSGTEFGWSFEKE